MRRRKGAVAEGVLAGHTGGMAGTSESGAGGLLGRILSARTEPSAEPLAALANYQSLVARVVDAFGDEIKASRWLSLPHPDLDGKTPLEVAQRDNYNARLLEPILISMEHGIDY